MTSAPVQFAGLPRWEDDPATVIMFATGMAFPDPVGLQELGVFVVTHAAALVTASLVDMKMLCHCDEEEMLYYAQVNS